MPQIPQTITLRNLFKILGGFVNGRTVVDPSVVSNEIAQREYIGTDYAKEFQKAELLRFKHISNNTSTISDGSKMTLDEIDDLGASCDTNIDVYQRYNFRIKKESNLPIMMSKDNILKKLEESPVIVLQGATGKLTIFFPLPVEIYFYFNYQTGCGKTTQVPQFILDDAVAKGKYCNIIVTQPRRIAAVSIAKRISAERRWELPSIIGYQVLTSFFFIICYFGF